MSIKIRPIKCPNCGSEKHDQLNETISIAAKTVGQNTF